MELVVSHEQGRVPVTVFRVKGDIDMTTSEELLEQARQVFEAGTTNLLIDLAEVLYMSSAGIRALNSIFNRLRTDSPAESDEAMRKGLAAGTFKSPHLKLLNPSSAVRQVLSMTGIDMFLEIHRNLKDAVASF